jgi:hypothetical protein
MRGVIGAMVCIGAMLLSCVSKHGNNDLRAAQPVDYSIPVEQNRDDAAPAKTGKDAASVGANFDPKNPPLELYTATKLDIQNFIRKVDDLIKSRNYEEWTKLLSQSYFETINSKTFLDTVSQQPRLKSQNIVLRNGRDYFLNVVVTSRVNMRANDIEFITLTRVMAFTENQSGQRIRIYTLDKTPDSWEIID